MLLPSRRHLCQVGAHSALQSPFSEKGGRGCSLVHGDHDLHLQAFCVHNKAWTSLLPTSMPAILKAVEDRDQHMQLPMTMNRKRRLIPLSVLLTLDPVAVHSPLMDHVECCELFSGSLIKKYRLGGNCG